MTQEQVKYIKEKGIVFNSDSLDQVLLPSILLEEFQTVQESPMPQVKKQEPAKTQITPEIKRDYILVDFFKKYPTICIGAAISFVVILYFIIGSPGSSLNISSMSNFHPAISMTSTGMSLYNPHTGMNISMKY